MPGVGWNYLSIPWLQRLHHCSFGINKWLQPILYGGYNYLSLLGFKSNHVSKRRPRNANLPWRPCDMGTLFCIARPCYGNQPVTCDLVFIPPLLLLFCVQYLVVKPLIMGLDSNCNRFWIWTLRHGWQHGFFTVAFKTAIKCRQWSTWF